MKLFMKMKKCVRTIVRILLVLYTLGLLYLMFVKDRGGILSGVSLGEYMKEMSNFVPFQTIGTYVSALWNGTMNRIIILKNLVGNLVLFMPFAYFLYFFTKMKLKKMIVLTIIILLVLEMLQLFTRSGAFDVDDFILNLAGAIVIYWFLWRKTGSEKDVSVSGIGEG